jgi:endonuclease III
MAVHVMRAREAIEALSREYPGRFSVELGIDLSAGWSREVFRWFLASVLFGARISGTIVKRTFREFASRNVVSPEAVLATGWDGLVEILDRGGYVRYDFKTATRLLELSRTLRERYDGDLANLHAAAADPHDLEERLKSLAKGIGDVTVSIFLREMRGIWKKAEPLPSDLAVMAAKARGIVHGSVRDRRKVLALLEDAWCNAGGKKRELPDLEAMLVRAGLELRRKKRRKGSN